MVALLHPDAVLLSDGGGVVRTARRTVVGADKVARLLLGLFDKYELATATWTPVLVNGAAGVHTSATGVAPEAVTSVAVTDGRISGIYQVLNPAKLP
jgi:RNA polymerase sigma-70 factor (ECF subfamily)